MAVDQVSIAADLTAKIVAVNAAISAVGSLEIAPPQVLKTVYAPVQDALASFESAISAYDADIDTSSVGGVVAGLPAPQLAAALLNQALDVAQQGRLVIAMAFTARVGVNVLNAPG
jgi:hypothetical protein